MNPHSTSLVSALEVGNSGGALVNSNGDLVGITSAQFKTRENLNIQGIFFAVPYTLAKEVMGKLIRHGRVVRGYLGFEGTAVDRQILPPLGNQFVYILKMSSLVSVIGLSDLTRRANELVVNEYLPLEIYTFLVLEYLLLILFVSQAVRWLEKRIAIPSY